MQQPKASRNAHHIVPERELQGLYDLEYGDRIEFGVRVAAIVTATILYLIYTGSMLAQVWLGFFLLGHASLYSFFLNVRASGRARQFDLNVAIFLLLLTQAAYFWLPVTLLSNDDPILRVGGIAGCVTMLFFLLRRGDTYMPLIIGETGIVVVGTLFLLVTFIPQFETPFDKLCVAFCVVMASYYFVAAMLKSREVRLQAEAMVQRSQQEQKLASIGRLAGGVAHDFNNALTGISGNLELFFEVDDPIEREGLLRVAQASSARAAKLVKQLLIFARKSDIETSEHCVGAIVEEAVSFQRSLLPANIELETVLEDGLRVETDRDLLVTALINLSVNSVDAMKAGGRLSFTAERILISDQFPSVDGRTLGAGPYVRITIADTGHGIPSDVFPRVIEPFFSTKPPGHGSGLGLSMVLGLVQSMSGGMEIDSSSEGTRVSILMPEPLDGAPAEQESPQALAEPPFDTARLSPRA